MSAKTKNESEMFLFALAFSELDRIGQDRVIAAIIRQMCGADVEQKGA